MDLTVLYGSGEVETEIPIFLRPHLLASVTSVGGGSSLMISQSD